MRAKWLDSVVDDKLWSILVDENGQELGRHAGAVGPHGDCTGIFCQCETTDPISELGITIIDEE